MRALGRITVGLACLAASLVRSACPGIPGKERKDPSAKFLEGRAIGRLLYDDQQIDRPGQLIPVEPKGLPDESPHPVTCHGPRDPFGYRDAQPRESEVRGIYNEHEDPIGNPDTARAKPKKIGLAPYAVSLAERLLFHPRPPSRALPHRARPRTAPPLKVPV